MNDEPQRENRENPEAREKTWKNMKFVKLVNPIDTKEDCENQKGQWKTVKKCENGHPCSPEKSFLGGYSIEPLAFLEKKSLILYMFKFANW